MKKRLLASIQKFQKVPLFEEGRRESEIIRTELYAKVREEKSFLYSRLAAPKSIVFLKFFKVLLTYDYVV